MFWNFNLDFNVWKYTRTDVDIDDCPEIPNTITISKLKDGQILSVEGATIKVYHTPGHTTDHVILTMDNNSVLFSGDCILGV